MTTELYSKRVVDANNRLPWCKQVEKIDNTEMVKLRQEYYFGRSK